MAQTQEPIELKMNVTSDRGVHFDHPIPQIERNRKFQVIPGKWDLDLVNTVKLSNFRSLVFDHLSDKFEEGGDKLSYEFAFASDPGADDHWKILESQPQTFPFDNDRLRVTQDKHRLIEFDLEIETPDGKTVVIDPAWDEKP